MRMELSGWNGHEGCCVFRAPFDCSGLTSRGIFKPEGSGSNPRTYKNIYAQYMHYQQQNSILAARFQTNDQGKIIRVFC